MDPCYFCELIDGGAEPWNVIHRDEPTVTMLNGRQYEVGQCMIVSRRNAAVTNAKLETIAELQRYFR